jgi:transposase
MDKDPSQTSKAARKAMEKSEAKFHKIPATSSDLNSIENLFHLVKKSLENEAIANNIM